jgi:hypothetical protein
MIENTANNRKEDNNHKNDFLAVFNWENFLNETKMLAEKLPDEDKGRLVELAKSAYTAEDTLEDKFWFNYSFGAARITKEESELPIDIFVSQDIDYLYRTGKVKVFFKISKNEESIDLGIVENGKYYQKEFDKQDISDETINKIINFTFNNRYLLQAYTLGYYNFKIMIKGYELVNTDKINNQIEGVKKLVTAEELSKMEKWWGKEAEFNSGLNAEFNYNYLSRLHKLYFKEFRFGQMLYIFTDWYKKRYNSDYFAEKDTEMANIILEFITDISKDK